MPKTRIQWATDSWNPITGCTPISVGCDYCYARKMAETRLRGRAGYPEDDPFRPGTIHLNRMNAPGGKPKNVFVVSMGDLFHKKADPRMVQRVLRACLDQSQHRYLFLTKRPWNMYHACLSFAESNYGYETELMPVFWWMGASTEDQPNFDLRAPKLARINANRWISVEPMLGPIDISKHHESIDWVVVGGETKSTRARRMKLEWVKSLLEQCREYRIPFFLKAWGEWIEDGAGVRKNTEKSSRLYGSEYKEFPWTTKK